MRWRARESEKKEWLWPDGILCVSSQTHLWLRHGWCGELSQVDSWQCSGNLLHQIQTHPQYAGSSGSAGRMCAWPGNRRSLWSRIFQGWAWIQREREGRDEYKERWWHSSRWALEGFRTEEMAESFTYSPSAIHSISSTCPLNTILELEGPDGMRKLGLLSSIGSSVVAHELHKSSYYISSAYYTVKIQAWTRPFTFTNLPLPHSAISLQHTGIKPLHCRVFIAN